MRQFFGNLTSTQLNSHASLNTCNIVMYSYCQADHEHVLGKQTNTLHFINLNDEINFFNL